MELMDLTKVTNTGKLNYHLKVLGGLIEKQSDGRYSLTQRGQLAVQLIDNFPKRGTRTTVPKKKTRKLLATAILLLACIVAVSLLLIILAPPASSPSLSVVYWRQQPDELHPDAVGYAFNVTGSSETSTLVPTTAMNHALAPYVNSYPFVTMTAPDGTIIPFWTSQYIHNGQFVVTVSLQNPLTDPQLASLTQNLKQALQSIQ
jgi:hypothetical protein